MARLFALRAAGGISAALPRLARAFVAAPRLATPRRFFVRLSDVELPQVVRAAEGTFANEVLMPVSEVARILTEEKGQEVFVLDMQGMHGGRLGDTLVIVTGANRRHMHHLAESVRAAARASLPADAPEGAVPPIEDEDSEDWMLVDLGSVVLHVFSEKGRAFYDLDAFWTANVRRHVSSSGDAAVMGGEGAEGGQDGGSGHRREADGHEVGADDASVFDADDAGRPGPQSTARADRRRASTSPTSRLGGG
ncbi:hypothetical protein KFE25_002830 [Diacronema lutheri]|uniref:Ribosomal silencing factor RsfS n=2 Tax=Diacronema lutheri TaxID=2081491 RepID=A0A8J5XJ48_DIALT|nr:hypothetical protein KFE25_002830 [Diacronema lutheri]